MDGDEEVGGWEGEEARERAECLIFAGRGEKCYLGGGSLQRPIHLGSWQPRQQGVGVCVGGVKKEKRRAGVGGYDEGAYAAGESAKVQDSLNGFSSAM